MKLSSGRLCRKCNSPIPNRTKINGSFRSLQRRKFCLICSPFGSHNTKPDDPSRPSRTSDKIGARKAWALTAKRAFDAARKLKAELIEMSGGACVKCGYRKYIGALEFHHLDPKTKLFGLAAGNLRGKSRERVIEEWKKCVLVCSNCHRELEAEERT